MASVFKEHVEGDGRHEPGLRRSMDGCDEGERREHCSCEMKTSLALSAATPTVVGTSGEGEDPARIAATAEIVDRSGWGCGEHLSGEWRGERAACDLCAPSREIGTLSSSEQSSDEVDVEDRRSGDIIAAFFEEE